jgi:hypothetical protein
LNVPLSFPLINFFLNFKLNICCHPSPNYAMPSSPLGHIPHKYVNHSGTKYTVDPDKMLVEWRANE